MGRRPNIRPCAQRKEATIEDSLGFERLSLFGPLRIGFVHNEMLPAIRTVCIGVWVEFTVWRTTEMSCKFIISGRQDELTGGHGLTDTALPAGRESVCPP